MAVTHSGSTLRLLFFTYNRPTDEHPTPPIRRQRQRCIGDSLTAAAASLGITRQSLYRRMEKFGFQQ